MYTFNLDFPPDSLKQDLQCYAEMQDGSIIPVRLIPGNLNINETSTTKTITVNWKTN